ncbi:MAG: DUF4625 domain-containing protein [Flavobacteriaceae bacterium]
MKNIKFITVLAVVTALFTVSCSDDDSGKDTQKPTITIVEPFDEQAFDAGNEIHVEVDFTDNTGLASYKIDIHFAGDGHQHRGITEEGHEEWAYETTGSLSGTSDNIHLHIPIPENTEEGHYHFGVYAVDTSGNQQVVWSEIEIHND